MKKYTTLLFFVLGVISLSAQNRDIKNADKLFDRYEYVQAAKEYKLFVENGNVSPYVYKKLGDCYYNIYNSLEAERWYAQAVKSKQNAETFYRYAQMLKSNGKYVESNYQMKIFAEMMPNDQRAKEFNKNPDYLSKLLNGEKYFDLNKLDINSQRSDFGATLFGNTLYFASARNENNTIYGWNNEPFLDIYQCNYNADGTYSEPVLVSDLNTKYHEGPVSVSRDGNIIYFSSESFNDELYQKDNVNKLKLGQVNLYKAINENGSWTSKTPLPFNSKSYSTSNPSIDREGKTLYFSSDMPGSIGGIDIWKVKVNNDGTFGTPENLGDKINTTGDESFPYITDENVLYFSSNGLTGFGGYDVFAIDLNKNGEPINMGKPVNSERDDFAFTFNNEKNIGYVSSNRSGEDHIYSAIPVCKAQISTLVKDSKTGKLLSDSKVVILDEDSAVLNTQKSNEKGETHYKVDCQKKYGIEIYKDGYVSKKISMNQMSGGNATIEALLDPIEVIVTETEIILNPIYFDYNKSDITEQGALELDKLVYIMSQNKELVIFVKSHTDSRGDDAYNLNLSDKRAISTVQYIISKGINPDRISGKGFGESEPKVDCKGNCTEEEYKLNRRSEFMIVKK